MNDYNMSKARKSYNNAKNLFKNRSERDCVFAIKLLDRDVCLEYLSDAVRCKNHQLLSCARVLRGNIWHHLLTFNKDKYWNKYLESLHWEQKCNNVLKRYDHKCPTCGRLAEKVYHKRSDKLGKEPHSDLVPCCKDCYQKKNTAS